MKIWRNPICHQTDEVRNFLVLITLRNMQLASKVYSCFFLDWVDFCKSALSLLYFFKETTRKATWFLHKIFVCLYILGIILHYLKNRNSKKWVSAHSLSLDLIGIFHSLFTKVTWTSRWNNLDDIFPCRLSLWNFLTSLSL